MRGIIAVPVVLTIILSAAPPPAGAAPWGLPEPSEKSKACIECHKKENAAIYQQWGDSKHYRASVGCYECHAAQEGEPDAFEHEGELIATIVSPKDCARCHEKFAKPGQELYALAKPLLTPVEFANKIDFTWFEIWHHEGRRARHGASMMGPDYTHWHGTYEVARNFYSEFVPELKELIHEGKASGDAEKVAAAEKLEKRLQEVLESDNHKWYLNKMDPAEEARRAKAAEEFRQRYGK